MASKSRTYHHLLTREDDGKWYPQFGDYDKECVKQERLDTYLSEYKGDGKYKAKDIKIVTLADGQQALLEYLSDINAEIEQQA